MICRNGHDTEALGLTADGRCRACQRARQNRWTKTEKGKANYARHDITRRPVMVTPVEPAEKPSTGDEWDARYGTNQENHERIPQCLAERVKMTRAAIRLRHSVFADEDIKASPDITKVERSEIRLRHSCDADAELHAILPAIESAFWWSIDWGFLPPVPVASEITAISMSIPRGGIYDDPLLKWERYDREHLQERLKESARLQRKQLKESGMDKLYRRSAK